MNMTLHIRGYWYMDHVWRGGAANVRDHELQLLPGPNYTRETKINDRSPSRLSPSRLAQSPIISSLTFILSQVKPPCARSLLLLLLYKTIQQRRSEQEVSHEEAQEA
jgi:hypothetical protein